MYQVCFNIIQDGYSCFTIILYSKEYYAAIESFRSSIDFCKYHFGVFDLYRKLSNPENIGHNALGRWLKAKDLPHNQYNQGRRMRIKRIISFATDGAKKGNSNPQKVAKKSSDEKKPIKQRKSNKIQERLNNIKTLINILDSTDLQCKCNDENKCQQKERLSSLRAKFETLIKMKKNELKSKLKEKGQAEEKGQPSAKGNKRSLIHAILFRFLPCLPCYVTNI